MLVKQHLTLKLGLQTLGGQPVIFNIFCRGQSETSLFGSEEENIGLVLKVFSFHSHSQKAVFYALCWHKLILLFVYKLRDFIYLIRH